MLLNIVDTINLFLIKLFAEQKFFINETNKLKLKVIEIGDTTLK